MTKAGIVFETNVHIGCYAHTLNLAAQKCLKIADVNTILQRVRHIARFFHHSNLATFQLRQKAETCQLPQHKLIIDVPTRWNSSFDMILRFLEMHDAVFSVLRMKEFGKDKDEKMRSLTDDEYKLLEDMVKVLKPLKDITTALCTESSPTVSVIMPLQFQLMQKVLIVDEEDSEQIARMKAVLREDLSKRYTKIVENLNTYTAMDPRFKHLPHLDINDKEGVFQNVIAEAVALSSKLKQSNIKEEPAEATPALPSIPGIELEPSKPSVVEENEATSVEPPLKKIKKEAATLQDIFGDICCTGYEPPTKSPLQIVEAEVNEYRTEQQIPFNTSPLVWWKTREFKYPTLALLAKAVLCIPATSVPAERVFSSAGDLLSAQRATMKASSVDKLLFLKKNWK